jgi:hypothetical protein
MVFLFSSSEHCNVKTKIAEWASLFALLILGQKPLLTTFDMDHVPATRNHDHLQTMLVFFHTNNTIFDIKTMLGFVKFDDFKDIHKVLHLLLFRYI